MGAEGIYAIIILIFGCYIFLTLILIRIYLIIGGNKTFENIVMFLWGSFPFICIITIILLIVIYYGNN